MKEIKKIVITGGPCAGKTTALRAIREKLSALGYGVVVVAETATEIIVSGLNRSIFSTAFDFQQSILNMQLAKEKCYEESCQKMKGVDKVVLVYDRAVMDGKAYIEDDGFAKLIKESNLSESEIFKRYDAVFKLVTAANGAEKFYTLENNDARHETIEEAIVLDDKITKCWKGHHYFRIIDNSTDFENKIKRLINEILTFLGES